MVLNNKSQSTLFFLNFALAILVFVVFIAFIPALSSIIGFSVGTEGLNCSADFTLECLIMYFFLPAIALTLLSVILGIIYLKFVVGG